MNKYYAFVQDGKINGCGMCPCTGENLQSIEISEDIYNNILKFGNEYYVCDAGEIKINPDYETMQAEKEKQNRIDEIKLELENIDKQRTRALAEPEIKDETTGETWLEYYNNQAKSLREELKELENGKLPEEENVNNSETDVNNSKENKTEKIDTDGNTDDEL